MIKFRLACAAGHEFDSWFASGAAFDQLRAAGALSCAICGHGSVSKAIMAPALTGTAKAPEIVAPPPAPAEPAPAASASPPAFAALPEPVAAALQVLKRHVEANFDNVGKRFAEEARRIHYGEAPARGIAGEASRSEIEQLAEEGIETLPLPWTSSRSDA